MHLPIHVFFENDSAITCSQLPFPTQLMHRNALHIADGLISIPSWDHNVTGKH